jgi:hydrogenase maturation protease
MREPCVIGIGCDDHGDQIAGLLVVRAIAAAAPGALALHESSGAPAELIAAWRNASHATVVEAMPGDQPGEVRQCDPLSRARVSGCLSARVSPRLREALALGPLPPRITVITIDAQCFVAGAPVSYVVASAADGVAAAILAELLVSAGR